MKLLQLIILILPLLILSGCSSFTAGGVIPKTDRSIWSNPIEQPKNENNGQIMMFDAPAKKIIWTNKGSGDDGVKTVTGDAYISANPAKGNVKLSFNSASFVLTTTFNLLATRVSHNETAIGEKANRFDNDAILRAITIAFNETIRAEITANNAKPTIVQVQNEIDLRTNGKFAGVNVVRENISPGGGISIIHSGAHGIQIASTGEKNIAVYIYDAKFTSRGGGQRFQNDAWQNKQLMVEVLEEVQGTGGYFPCSTGSEADTDNPPVYDIIFQNDNFSIKKLRDIGTNTGEVDAKILVLVLMSSENTNGTKITKLKK